MSQAFLWLRLCAENIAHALYRGGDVGIPYTPISLAILIGVLAMPLFMKLSQRFALLGGLAGALLWDQVAARLMESVNVSIPLEANMAVTAPVLVALHLALMSAAVLLIAIPITSPRGLIKRK